MAEALDSVVAAKELLIETAFKYNIDFKQRSFWINGTINEKMLRHVEACLSVLESDSNKTITVRINSPGGYCYEALAIVSRLRASKCRIKTEGHGHIMSAATLILACGHKRSISSLASFMYHEASGGIGGRVSEIQAWAAQYQREQELWSKTMAQFTNKDASFWQEAGKHTDKFYDCDELIEMGVVDKILPL